MSITRDDIDRLLAGQRDVNDNLRSVEALLGRSPSKAAQIGFRRPNDTGRSSDGDDGQSAVDDHDDGAVCVPSYSLKRKQYRI